MMGWRALLLLVLVEVLPRMPCPEASAVDLGCCALLLLAQISARPALRLLPWTLVAACLCRRCLSGGDKASAALTPANALCRDPGSSRGPLDLQSDALPTDLSRLLLHADAWQWLAAAHESPARATRGGGA